MRFLLSFLLCFVFLEVQTFAQESHIGSNGGPNYGSLGTISGTYAGVLLPTSSTGTASTSGTSSSTSSSSSASNSLGLFTLGISTTGPGTGAFLIFSGNRILNGTINAIADPNSQLIQGILNATFNYTFDQLLETSSGDTLNTVSATASVNGTLKATVGAGPSSATSSAQVLTGTAETETNQGGITSNGNPIVTQTQDYTVEGTQQSTTVAAGTFSIPNSSSSTSTTSD